MKAFIIIILALMFCVEAICLLFIIGAVKLYRKTEKLRIEHRMNVKKAILGDYGVCGI